METATEEQAAADLRVRLEILSMIRPELFSMLHGRWKGPIASPRAPQGLWFFGGSDGRLKVCVSPWKERTAPVEGEPTWLHVSVSIENKMPSYQELTEVRERFFRPTDAVIHVWPPASEHVNDHETCLHLWCRLDGRTVPDLRAPNGGI